MTMPPGGVLPHLLCGGWRCRDGGGRRMRSNFGLTAPTKSRFIFLRAVGDRPRGGGIRYWRGAVLISMIYRVSCAAWTLLNLGTPLNFEQPLVPGFSDAANLYVPSFRMVSPRHYGPIARRMQICPLTARAPRKSVLRGDRPCYCWSLYAVSPAAGAPNTIGQPISPSSSDA